MMDEDDYAFIDDYEADDTFEDDLDDEEEAMLAEDDV